MNCPSRVEHAVPVDWNQNPDALNADATTRNDLNHIANLRHSSRSIELDEERDTRSRDLNGREEDGVKRWGEGQGDAVEMRAMGATAEAGTAKDSPKNESTFGGAGYPTDDGTSGERGFGAVCNGWIKRVRTVLVKYVKFVGPGFMVAVAYIDPGNYATDVAAGATYEYKLLFMILVSNLFAIFLQSLCVKLGTVSGMNLAENCKAHCPPWLNYTLFCFAEAAIIATDIAEVIGSAIALNLLLNIPLVAGCAISIIDVLIILFWYRPMGKMRGVRAFEIFVMLLVIGVVVCFCFQLSLIKDASIGDVFRGYLPSEVITQSKGHGKATCSLTRKVLTVRQALPSVRHPRRNGHAAQPLPRQRYRAVPPPRLRRGQPLPDRHHRRRQRHHPHRPLLLGIHPLRLLYREVPPLPPRHQVLHEL